MRIRYALAIGLAIREAFSFWTAHPFDFEIWIRLGYYVSKGLDPYRYTGPVPGLSLPGTGSLPSIGYPPLWPLIQALVYDFYSALDVSNRFLYYFIVKQEMIIPDLVVGYLLFLVLSRSGRGTAGKQALLFWMLCPFVIVVSALWGMFDQLVLVFVLAALLFRQDTLRSSLAEWIGILLKGIPIIFLPVLVQTQPGVSRKLFYLTVCLALTAVLSLVPYLLLPSWNYSALAGTGTDIVHKVGNSLNYWIVPYVMSNVYGVTLNPSFLGAVGYIWIPALAVAYVFCYRPLQRRGLALENLVLTLLVVTLVFFLTRTQINEQYVIYFIGLGLLDLALSGPGRKRLFHGIWVSGFVFLFANNTYMVRFLAPVSVYYSQLDSSLTSGLSGDVRFSLMLTAGLAFTAFCVAYLRSVCIQLSSQGVLEPQVSQS